MAMQCLNSKCKRYLLHTTAAKVVDMSDPFCVNCKHAYHNHYNVMLSHMREFEVVVASFDTNIKDEAWEKFFELYRTFSEGRPYNHVIHISIEDINEKLLATKKFGTI